MNCHRLSNLLSAYIDGELTGVEMIEIRNHLDGCPACQDDLDQVRAMKRLVGRLRTAQPAADLGARICASLDGVQPKPVLGAWLEVWNSTFRKLSPAVATMCAIVFGLVVFASRNVDDRLIVAHSAPMVTASAPSFSLPASLASEQEPTHLSEVFHPVQDSQRNSWIVPASYSVSR
jgi:anti-sigma factor RsiW